MFDTSFAQIVKENKWKELRGFLKLQLNVLALLSSNLWCSVRVKGFFSSQVERLRSVAEVSFIFFYAPWCAHSMAARQEVQQVAKKLAKQVQVNGTSTTQDCLNIKYLDVLYWAKTKEAGDCSYVDTCYVIACDAKCWEEFIGAA